jgi:nucleoside-diphosphate kinase
MSGVAGPPFTYNVSFTDPSSKFEKPLILSFWPTTGEVALHDAVQKRAFLRRMVPAEAITQSALYIGATIVIASRPIKVLSYGDATTARVVGSGAGSALLLVLPHAYAASGKVLTMLRNEGIRVGRLRMVRFSEAEAAEFLAGGGGGAAGTGGGAAAGGGGAGGGGGGGGGGADDASTAAELSSDVMLAIECVGDDVLARVNAAIGPADPAAARDVAPRSVRAVLGGADRRRKVVRASRSATAAAAELAFIFERPRAPTAVATHCAVCIVKPHAVAEGVTGDVLDALFAAGLEVSALKSLAITRADAADLLEPYKGVTVEFERWVAELASAPAVAIEVRGPAAVDTLRALAGPYDVAVAKTLRPDSLRARFGHDNVKNAVHCTDCEQDGPLESKFLFTVI